MKRKVTDLTKTIRNYFYDKHKALFPNYMADFKADYVMFDRLVKLYNDEPTLKGFIDYYFTRDEYEVFEYTTKLLYWYISSGKIFDDYPNIKTSQYIQKHRDVMPEKVKFKVVLEEI